MQLNGLLMAAGLDLRRTCLVLHKTTEQPLRRMLVTLAHHNEPLFDAYQAVHSDKASATLRQCKTCLSFVAGSGEALTFVGCFTIDGFEERPTLQIYANPYYQTLAQDYGSLSSDPGRNIAARETQQVFRLNRSTELADVCWRLQIVDPGGRAYVRRCHTTDPSIHAILPEPLTAPPVPDWRNFIVTTQELRTLPHAWAEELRRTRGIYLIVDQSDGARYVGAAYGHENILARWQEHVRQDQGVTRQLRRRNPSHFRFSVLERVSPDMEVADITALEQTWMDRLQTRDFGLNQ